MCYGILLSLLDEENGKALTVKSAVKQLSKTTYFTDQQSGQRKLGLCSRLIRKKLKVNPYITVDEMYKDIILA